MTPLVSFFVGIAIGWIALISGALIFVGFDWTEDADEEEVETLRLLLSQQTERAESLQKTLLDKICRIGDLEDSNKKLQQKISHQRHEIKNRLIEISNLVGFKRNVETSVALRCPEEFKGRPLGGINWLWEQTHPSSAELLRKLYPSAPKESE